ncbi:MAG: hypothetical protein IJV29_14445, partial [Butyrivibrio sp.]|nr:hypothetical protein [Butyrivibrio sp.]
GAPRLFASIFVFRQFNYTANTGLAPFKMAFLLSFHGSIVNSQVGSLSYILFIPYNKIHSKK